MSKDNVPYQKEHRKREYRFNDEQKTLRRGLRDIRLLLITLVWCSVISGAIVAGIFVRLLFWRG